MGTLFATTKMVTKLFKEQSSPSNNLLVWELFFKPNPQQFSYGIHKRLGLRIQFVNRFHFQADILLYLPVAHLLILSYLHPFIVYIDIKRCDTFAPLGFWQNQRIDNHPRLKLNLI